MSIDLKGLLERVEAASGPNFALEQLIHETLFPLTVGDGGFYPPYTASIDAAVALVERVLPGWDCDVGAIRKGEPNFAYLWERETYIGGDAAQGATPALAVIAALLKAKASQS